MLNNLYLPLYPATKLHNDRSNFKELNYEMIFLVPSKPFSKQI